MQYIAILGRQPALSLAELERVFGGARRLSTGSAIFETDLTPDVERLGGTPKVGRVVFELSTGDWRTVSNKIVQSYSKSWAGHDGKITLGLSVYDLDVPARDIQKTGIILKAKLRSSGVSLRLVPSDGPALSTATSHHNKLGLADNKVELLIARAPSGRIVVAESIGAQNITALARRDQGRPKRDAFVGMLPPKLAQIMINLALGDEAPDSQLIVLDPFCGTGVLLQEAALLGYGVYGSDLNEKMIRYARDNLNWLRDSHQLNFDWYLHEGDATETSWRQPIGAVVSEVYLGQPFSAPPSPAKLTEVRGNCNHIIGNFLKNIAPQLPAGTPLCLAIPAWRNKEGGFTHLPLINKLAELGYEEVRFESVQPHELLYYREDQVVARELLVLRRA